MSRASNLSKAGALVGSDGKVPTAGIADGAITQAKFAANVAGNGPAFRAYASTQTTLTSAYTRYKVTLASEYYDTNGNFLSSRFTPTVAGYYQISGSVGITTTDTIRAFLYKNGSAFSTGTVAGNGAFADNPSTVSDLIYMNGTTDYVELYAESSTASRVTKDDSSITWISGSLVRAA
jgi:hypothetical protein